MLEYNAQLAAVNPDALHSIWATEAGQQVPLQGSHRR
jgi:hypothetical protein